MPQARVSRNSFRNLGGAAARRNFEEIWGRSGASLPFEHFEKILCFGLRSRRRPTAPSEFEIGGDACLYPSRAGQVPFEAVAAACESDVNRLRARTADLLRGAAYPGTASRRRDRRRRRNCGGRIASRRRRSFRHLDLPHRPGGDVPHRRHGDQPHQPSHQPHAGASPASPSQDLSPASTARCAVALPAAHLLVDPATLLAGCSFG